MVFLVLWLVDPVQALEQYTAQVIPAPSSAVALVLVGLGTLLLEQPFTVLRRGTLLLGAVTLIAMGGSVIAAELIRPGLHLPLDSFFVAATSSANVSQLPATAFNVAVFGLVLLLCAFGASWQRMLGQVFALLIVLNSVRDLALSGASLFWMHNDSPGGAPAMSLFFAAVTISLLRCFPPPQLLAGIRSTGSRLPAVWLLIFPAVIIPIVIELISRWEARVHAFGAGFETLLLIGLNIGLIWWFAESLADSEQLRMRADRARIESEQRLKLITDQMPAILWSTDLQLRITAIHGSVLNPLSIDPLPYLGRDVGAIVGDDESGRIAVRAHREAINGTSARYERNVGKRSFDVRVEPLRDLGNRIVGVVSLALDITERREMETAIQELNSILEQRVAERTRQLEAVNEELEAFCYSVSHDLRAPLRSIDGFSQALLEDYADHLDDEGRTHLQRVRNASQRMARLIDDLLALSRVTRSSLERRSVNLSTLAQSILDDLHRTEPQRQVHLTIQPDLWADVDGRLMTVALTNLLENAWKFTARQPLALISLTRTYADEGAIYHLSDNGAGFAMSSAQRLFQPFQRLHHERDFPGTGIGLATVKRVIARHGGQIWAVGAPDEGATFSFTLLPSVGRNTHLFVDHVEDIHGAESSSADR